MLRNLVIASLFGLLILSCTERKHFISDPEYRVEVDIQFEKQKLLAGKREAQLFSELDNKMSLEEKEALEFLFAYMPINDLADYNGEYFYKVVKSTFAARDTFSWGSKVPEELFRHFVLPYRVNNERSDSARWVIFNELKDRIKHMNMYDAALEVNHWCHEKVNYRPTDIRTSAPLATIKTAYGRCGEESTLTVAAMRAVGIPARQVYTPRWAHCDDNHAWVEIWADGEWYFLGACEPSPDLNQGWFTEPARRAMLVNTKTFGPYYNDSLTLSSSEKYSILNTLPVYAKTKTVYVQVLNESQEAVNSAIVEFQLYNYAEFYPIARLETDDSGFANFTTGYGDLIVWARKENQFSFKKISVAEVDTLVLTIKQDFIGDTILNFVSTPPIKPEPVKSDDNGKKQNDIRLKTEDSIRNAYVESFIDSMEITKLAAEYSLSNDSLQMFFEESRGNWNEIKIFIENVADKFPKYVCLFLDVIADKDLRDMQAAIMQDHFIYSLKLKNEDIKTETFVKYIMNPRVSNEFITEYRSFFQGEFSSWKNNSDQEKVNKLRLWIDENIKDCESENYQNMPSSAVGTYQLSVAGNYSVDIFIVSALRSLNIPARLEDGTLKPIYFVDNVWIEFKENHDKEKKAMKKAFISLKNNAKNKIKDPEYFIDFTLAFFDDGRYNTLEYDWNKKLSTFPDKIELDAGKYLLQTGSRNKDGAVAVRFEFFELEENSVNNIHIEILPKPAVNQLNHKIDLDEKLLTDSNTEISLEDLMKEDIALLWLDPGTEPTRHVLEEIKALQKKYQSVAEKLVFLLPDFQEITQFKKEYGFLPAQSVYAFNNELLNKIFLKQGRTSSVDYPVIFVLNKNGKIEYFSEGYKIGVGNEILELF